VDEFPLGARRYHRQRFEHLAPEIYEELSREVIGQDEAMREVSVALVKHLVAHPAGNILLIGNSGTGKTTLMKAVEAMLARRRDLIGTTPLIRINANVLADEHSGYGKALELASGARVTAKH